MWSLLINLAILLVGLLVGLSAGFVLWSGLIMPPFFPGIVERGNKLQEQENNEKLGQGRPADNSGRAASGNRGSPKASSAKESETKRGNENDRGKPAPQPPPKEEASEKPATSHASKPEPPNPGETPANNTPQEQARPNKGDQTSKSQPIGPPPKDAEAPNVEIVAIPLEELTLSQVSELRASGEGSILPGGAKAASWKSTTLWNLEEWRKKGDLAVLKISDRSGQPRYYIQTPEPIKTVAIKLGEKRPIEVSPIPGINFELRCAQSWQGSSNNEYRLLVDNRERILLKIAQQAAKITVETRQLNAEDDGKQLPNDIPAEIGFYFTDPTTSTKVWVTIVQLKIVTGQADNPGSGKRSQDGGTL